MRAFVAVEVTGEVAAALGRVQARLRSGRPVAEENLHLTLAFLDDQPEERLEDLHGLLEQIARPAFTVTLNGLGCFGGDAPRLLYAAAEPSAPLLDLQRAVSRSARRSGMVLQGGEYRPHITLARFRGPEGQGVLPDLLEQGLGVGLPALAVRSFALFRSDLHPAGVRYEVLARYPLDCLGGGLG